MTYLDTKINEMKKNTGPILMSVGMVLRLILLCLVLIFGRFFCDFMVEQSNAHPDPYKIEQQTKERLRILRDLKTENKITTEQFKERAKATWIDLFK